MTKMGTDKYRYTLLKGLQDTDTIVEVSVTFLFDPAVFHGAAGHHTIGLQMIAAYQLKVIQTFWHREKV